MVTLLCSLKSAWIVLALKCNPSVLEVLATTPSFVNEAGEELRSLFPSFLSARLARAAFSGFAKSQKDRALSREIRPDRINKFMCHYLRMLYCGLNLLQTGQLIVDVRGWYFESTLRDAKSGKLDLAEALEIGRILEEKYDASPNVLPESPDADKIEDFLVRARIQNMWPKYTLVLNPPYTPNDCT